MNDLSNNMISLVKKTLPEIDLKLSNKIIECIEDVTNIKNEERNSIEHILTTYYCSYEAIENLRKYIKTSYYQIIEGEHYDRSLLLLADNLVKGQGDGRISEADMKKLVESALDGNRITDCEKKTLKFISKQYNTTDNGKEYLQKYFS
tara:strand:+ start:1282 stop:1725 length:444 start_codon:yes stop_codon:yes gene_type:complete